MADTTKLGAKLGPRIAALTAQAVVSTKQKLTPHQRSLGALILGDWFDLVGSEQRATIGEAVQQLADNDALPAWGRKLFKFSARGKGQWAMLTNFAVYGTGVGNVISQWISNEFAPGLHRMIANAPHGILSAETAAALYARGFTDHGQASHEAAQNAVDNNRFDLLVAAAQGPPGMGELIQLLQRKLITDDDVKSALHDASIRPFWRDKLPRLAEQLLPPASLADMVVRGIIEEVPAAHEAELQGVSGARFDKLVLQSGEPPAIQELLFLYRRGKINQARLVHGIRQSHVRNEWIDAIEALQYVPLTPADAIAAHVQGHIDEATSKRKWAEGGFEPADWQAAYETAGEPIAIGQALDLWDRGKMTEAEVTQAIRESRIKNKYIPFIKQLAVYLPPVRTVVALLRGEAITRERAMELFAENGVRPTDAVAYANEAQNNASKATREFTASQVQLFYRDGAITKVDANDMLRGLGYDQAHVDLILLNAELEKLTRARNQAINRVHASYVGHKIDRQTALADLSALQVTDTMAAGLADLWDDELNANVRVLTEPQVIKAAKKGLLSVLDALDYLRFLGYGDRDAAILLASEGLSPEGA